MSMNFPLKFVNDVIGIIESCGKNMIEFEKNPRKINGENRCYFTIVIVRGKSL